MDKKHDIPISIEKFAAYLDGNLPQDEISNIDSIIGGNPDMKALVSMSDDVDEDVQYYIDDDFLYEADITALENGDFDLPEIPPINNNELLLPSLDEPTSTIMYPSISYPNVAAADAAEPIDDDIDYVDPINENDYDEARYLDGFDGKEELHQSNFGENFTID